jgi:hypothetical protein
MDRREPSVACPCTVAALRLEVAEEGPDERGVEVFDRELARRLVKPLPREAEQETEAVAVASDRVGARVPLREQAISTADGRGRLSRGRITPRVRR